MFTSLNVNILRLIHIKPDTLVNVKHVKSRIPGGGALHQISVMRPKIGTQSD